MKTYKFHSDAGHGWLAVKVKELEELGIAAKVSKCSYIKGSTVYLEEDYDAGLFMNTYKAKHGEAPRFKELQSVDDSPIRGYDSFKL
jgi:hypothetical protein